MLGLRCCSRKGQRGPPTPTATAPVPDPTLHLIVETEDNRSLARGMNGLAVRIARSLNKLWNRVGRVFADRFHAHVLATPREAKNALRYVLRNTEKHGVAYLGGPDPFSSGEHFDGWRSAPNLADSCAALFGRARTWLLRVGWRRHGLLTWLDSSPHSRRCSPISRAMATN